MTDREYLIELGKIPGSRKNQIIRMVNAKTPATQAGLKTEVEKKFFNNLMSEAKAHEKKYGFWPVFEMCEIESDDPVLDIYSGSAAKRNK